MSDTVLKLTDVRLKRGARQILAGVELEAARAELVAIMGPSGAGKTTILRAVAGLERFESGRIAVEEVTLEGGETPTKTLRHLRRKVGLVFQFHHLFEHLSALENVCLAPIHAFGESRADAVRRARDLLGGFGVGHRADALPRELSGGEAQRVAIARALAVNPPLLLMDEPTASLDPSRRMELADLLRQLAAQGRTLVVATHDEEFARQFSTRIVRLDDGIVRTA